MSILVYARGELAVDSRVVITQGGVTRSDDSGRKFRFPPGPFTFHGHKVLLWAYVGSNIMARAWDYRYQLMANKGESTFLSYADTSRFLVLEEEMWGEQIIITDGPVYVASLSGSLVEYPADSVIVLGDAKDSLGGQNDAISSAWLSVAAAIRLDTRCGGSIHRFTFKEGAVQELRSIDWVLPLNTFYRHVIGCGRQVATTVKNKLTFK